MALSTGRPWRRAEIRGSTRTAAALALVYSGDRFGLTEPIPSIRLKIQRNCLQDIAVLDSFKNQKPLESLRSEAAHRFNNSVLDDWWNPRPALADIPSDQWQGSDIDAAMEHTNKALAHPGRFGLV